MLLRIGEPRGLAVAGDGTIYAVDAASKHVVRFSATGKRPSAFGPAFGDPYALALAAGGGLYVVDTSVAGHLVFINRNGSGSTLAEP